VGGSGETFGGEARLARGRFDKSQTGNLDDQITGLFSAGSAAPCSQQVMALLAHSLALR